MNVSLWRMFVYITVVALLSSVLVNLVLRRLDASPNYAVVTTMRFDFDSTRVRRRSTAYQRSLRSQ